MPWIAKCLLSHAITGMFTAALLVGVLRQKGSPASRALAGLLSGSLLWVLVNAMSEWYTIQGSPSDLIGGFAGVAIQVMVVSAFALCEILPDVLGKKSLAPGLPRVRLLLVAALSLAIAAMSFTDSYMGNRRVLANGSTTADYRFWFLAAGIWAAAVTLCGLILLFVKFSSEKDHRRRMQMKLYMLGIFLSLCLTMFFAFFLPLLGRSDLFFAGVDSSIIFAALMTYAILFHGMFDLRTALLRFLLRLVVSLLLAALIYGAFLTLFLEQNLSDLSIELLGAMSLFFVSVFVFAQKGLPVIDRLLMGRTPLLEELIRPLFELSADPSLDDDAGRVFRVLKASPHFSRGWLLIPHPDGACRLHRNEAEFDLPRKQRVLLQRLLFVDKLPDRAADALDRVYLLDEENLPALRQKRVTRALREAFEILSSSNMKALLPLTSGPRVCGWLALGERRDDLPFYTRDIGFLDSVRVALGILFHHRRHLWNSNRRGEEVRQDLARLTEAVSARTQKTAALSDRSLVYSSKRMHEAVDHALKLADSDRPVLITGETGTGKEVFARLIHQRSNRKDAPLVAVNCAAVTENLWEDELFGHVRGAFTDARGDRAGRIREAAAGVLFLDEIGEMPVSVQARLLRLLQEETFSPVGSDGLLKAHCRFVFATNRVLADMVKRGTFREDLYYRINVLEVQLPPLRDRPEDIPVLIDYYLERFQSEMGSTLRSVDPQALERLLRAAWPGNVRELENFLVRASLLCKHERLLLEDLPREMRRIQSPASRLVWTSSSDSLQIDSTLKELMDDYTKRILTAALKQTGGNRTQAAQLLGLKRGSLLYRMKELGIQ